MKNMTVLEMFGMAGLCPNEKKVAQRWSRFFDLLMLFALFWLPIQWYLYIQGEINLEVITTAAWALWWLFFLETFTLTLLSKHKVMYLKHNWMNILIIIAAFPPMWAIGSAYAVALRYIRVIILIRLGMPVFKRSLRLLSRNSFGTTLIVFFVATMLCGILAYYFDPSFGSPWEGIWWAWQTVTSVGYGDIVPHTVAGKVFAVFLMLLGVAFLSIVTANFAAFLIERVREEEKPEKRILKYLRNVEKRLVTIEKGQLMVNAKLDKIMKAKAKSSSESKVENKTENHAEPKPDAN